MSAAQPAAVGLWLFLNSAGAHLRAYCASPIPGFISSTRQSGAKAWLSNTAMQLATWGSSSQTPLQALLLLQLISAEHFIAVAESREKTRCSRDTVETRSSGRKFQQACLCLYSMQ
jgi:hypothetical protein